MAISSSSPTTISGSTSANPNHHDLVKQINRHEVAVAEINSLPSSRAVYHKQGNIFFRSTVKKVATFEQRQLDAAKAKLQNLSSPSS